METRFQLISLLRRVGRLGHSTTWSAALFAAVAVAVEIIGRQTTTDLQDCFALAVFGAMIGLGYCLRGRQAFAWAAPAMRLLHRGGSWLRGRRFEIGIDLRERPSVPAAIPPLIDEVLSLLGVAAVALLLTHLSATVEVRRYAVQIFYLGYLAGLAALWGVLMVAIATSVLLPAACIHDGFAARHRAPGRRARRVEGLAITGYFGAVLVAGLLLPLWVPTAICVTAVLLFWAVLRRSSSPQVMLLWRRRGSDEVRSLDWRRYELRCGVLLALAFAVLAFVALGRRAIALHDPVAETALPITVTLGALAAWLSSTALLAGALFASWWLLQQRRRDPARPCPPRAHIEGDSPHREQVAAVLQRRGWQVRFAPSQVRTWDVRLHAVAPPMPPPGSTPRWPLSVSAKALEVPELQQMLLRRSEIQRRRLLINGLQTLFKRAAQHTFRRGQGFWIGPHYWYIAGLTRDVDEDEYDPDGGTIVSGVIGPAYHVVLPRAARNHLHVILTALDIDLLFVEDGVGFAKLRTILRRLFEHYDVHGGRQRLEERHLTGVPGVRAVVHDYELGAPLKRKGYPEPDYETLGRARILHLFRDRGEHEEPVLDPTDWRDLPVPMAQ